jgi:preprotein translocase subunit Sss1
MDAIDSVFDPLREFAKDSVRLVKRCHKPDRKGLTLFIDSNLSAMLWYAIDLN